MQPWLPQAYPPAIGFGIYQHHLLFAGCSEHLLPETRCSVHCAAMNSSLLAWDLNELTEHY